VCQKGRLKNPAFLLYSPSPGWGVAAAARIGLVPPLSRCCPAALLPVFPLLSSAMILAIIARCDEPGKKVQVAQSQPAGAVSS
jgi:hypothetical protein